MSINVRPEFLQTAGEEVNKEAIRYAIGEILPSSGGNLENDIHFDFSTGANEYLDLYKLFISATITPTWAVTATATDVLTNFFNRAQLYINGYLVSTSNSYQHDSILNKRIAFSQIFNENANNMQDYTLAALVAGTAGEAIQASAQAFYYRDHLDALFIRHPGMFLPPNTQMKIILTANPAAISSALLKIDAGRITSLAMTNLKMHTNVLASPVKTPETYQLTLVVPDSFKGTAAATQNLQYTAKNSLVRVSADFTSNVATGTVAAMNLAGIKAFSPTHFKYVTDITDATFLPSTTGITSLQFKVGSQMLPQQPFDTANGFSKLCDQFNVFTDKDLDPAGGESIQYFCYRGPIWTVPVVRSATDHPRTIEVNYVANAAPAAHVHITAHYEQICTFNYGAMGEPIGFTKTV